MMGKQKGWSSFPLRLLSPPACSLSPSPQPPSDADVEERGTQHSAVLIETFWMAPLIHV